MQKTETEKEEEDRDRTRISVKVKCKRMQGQISIMLGKVGYIFVAAKLANPSV